MMDCTQDHPLLLTKERSASIGDGTPPEIVPLQRLPRKNSLPTYDKAGSSRGRKHDVELLEGEKILSKIPYVSLLRKGEIHVVTPRGDLYLTNFQLVYKPAKDTIKKNGVYYVQKNNATSNLHVNSTLVQQQIIRNMAAEEVRVPLMIINSVRKKSGQDMVKIKTHDMRELRFTFSSVESEPKFLNATFFNNVSNFLTAPLAINSPNGASNDIDLGTSLANLHTMNRTIGTSNASAFPLSPPTSPTPLSPTSPVLNGSPSAGDLVTIKPSSGAKVAEKVYEYIMRFTNLQTPRDLFAYHHKLLPAPDPSMDGWFIYDPIKEFTRMGIPDASWTISGVNNSYELCPTYPPFLSIPRAMSDPQLLRRCAEFRSKGRLPTLCWKSKESPATITRCSQPLVGYKGSRCPEDEMLVAKILELNPTSDELYIVDARPKVNALANQAGGEGGWESVQFYKSCKIMFMGLENIHIIRESYHKLFALINQQGSQVSWESEQEGSGWLRHIRGILLATREVTATVALGKSVMIHCSDGWDRTGLLSALSQLSLDPFYRSMRGFQILIEKEWLAFGHKFADRTGHQENQKMTSSEKCPVFIQFLDCVSQYIHQFPTSFQFSNSLLTLIADHVYSCRFGTFLCNSDCERLKQSLSSRTVSIWTYVNANINQFTNPFYDEKDHQVLFISCSPQSIVLWREYYLRHHPPFSSTCNTVLPPFNTPRINLENIGTGVHPPLSTTPPPSPSSSTSSFNHFDTLRASVAFLNKPSLTVYPLHSYDCHSWSPVALMEKRAREMAMQIQQLENELAALRKSKGKAGNYDQLTSFMNFLRLPKPTHGNKQAVVEAKRIIDLVLMKTIEIITSRNLSKQRHRQLLAQQRSQNNLFIPAVPAPTSPSSSPPPTPPPRPSRNGKSPPPTPTPSRSPPAPPPKTRALSEVLPRGKTPNPPQWTRDSTCSACEACGRQFTQVWRKHHCRACGMIFCANCSKKKIAIPTYQYFHPVRVCDPCYARVTSKGFSD